MPSAGGARFVVEGREVAAEVRESVRVVRRAGRVVNAAILEFWEEWLSRIFVSDGEAMIVKMAVFPGLALCPGMAA